MQHRNAELALAEEQKFMVAQDLQRMMHGMTLPDVSSTISTSTSNCLVTPAFSLVLVIAVCYTQVGNCDWPEPRGPLGGRTSCTIKYEKTGADRGGGSRSRRSPKVPPHPSAPTVFSCCVETVTTFHCGSDFYFEEDREKPRAKAAADRLMKMVNRRTEVLNY